jgi:hypothetical protein
MCLCNDTQSDTVDLVDRWQKQVFAYTTDAITDAVPKHNHCNSADDSKVLIALMDADRVANLDVDLFIRSGQNFHADPAVDYKLWLSGPEATYKKPRSVLRDIAYSLEWADPTNTKVGVRTKLGKQWAAERATVFRTFFAHLQQQLEQEGILPYPFDQ